MPLLTIPTVSRKSLGDVWHLAWPIILSNLSVPLLGAVDTAVIGHLPDPVYLASVGIGAMIFSFIYWGFGFLKMGTTGFIAQAAGAEDADQIRTVLAQSLIVGLGISSLLLMLHGPVLEFALYLIRPTEAVGGGASAYFNYRIWGAPAALVNYALLGLFIGLGKMRLALMTQVAMNGTNILLDVIFVVVLDMKVPGVALATALSEYLAAFIGLIFAYREMTSIGGNWIKSRILSLKGMRRLMSANADIFIRTILLILTFSYFTIAAARLGDEVLAAVTVVMNFKSFLAFGLDGFAHAAGTLVGRAIGRRKVEELDQAVWASSYLALLVAGLYMAVYVLLGTEIINLLTGIPLIRDISYSYLPWIIWMPFIFVWSYQLDGIFIGAMKSKEMRNGMILSSAAYFAAIEGLRGLLGMDGLWLALNLYMIMRGVTLLVFYGRVRRAARG